MRRARPIVVERSSPLLMRVYRCFRLMPSSSAASAGGYAKRATAARGMSGVDTGFSLEDSSGPAEHLVPRCGVAGGVLVPSSLLRAVCVSERGSSEGALRSRRTEWCAGLHSVPAAC